MTRSRLVAMCLGMAITLGLAIALSIHGGRRRPADPVPVPRAPWPVPAVGPTKIVYPYPDLRTTLDNYPNVDGSTSTQPLQTIMACKLFGMPSDWFHNEGADTRGLWPSTAHELLYGGAFDQLSLDQLNHQTAVCHLINGLVHTHGTSQAYINLIEARADLIFAARSPSEDELDRAGKRGVGLDARPVALDAFVFLLN
jgi:ABC-type phosphate transport system substrate-binding protein